MSDLPHQVNSDGLRRRTRVHRIVAAGAAAITAALLAGCSASDRQPGAWSEPLRFPDRASAPQLLVYGGLSTLLRHYDATPAIDRFLYGPNDFGKTVLRNPQGMAMMGSLLLVCDQGSQEVISINLATGKSVPWGDEDHRPRCPVDIARDETGLVYVADTTLRSVLVYDASQHFVEELTPSMEPSRSFRPAAVLVDRGTLYVGNIGDHRVDRWDLSAHRWLPPIVPPAGERGFIAPTGLETAADGLLFVVDAVQGVVFRIGADGKWLAPIGKPGRGPGEFVRPKQVRCTASGLVLVTDAGRQSVLVFRSDGTYFAEIHERAEGWTGFALPAGVMAVRSADLPLIQELVAGRSWPQADEYLLVSDSLGGTPLTLIGVVLHPAEVKANAG